MKAGVLTRVISGPAAAVLGLAVISLVACVPPPPGAGEENQPSTLARDEVSEIKCLQLLSSAAEYYKNKDWQSTVRVYEELVDLGCDKGSEEEVFQYWAVAYEYLGRFDSSEYVLLQGLKRLPDNLNLHNRLAYAYKRLGDTAKQIYEYERIVDLVSGDLEPLKKLSELYGEVGRYEDQIYILRKILEIEPNNKDAQGDLARAYEQIGKDPLDIYRQRFADNPENLSFGLDLADQLSAVGEYEEAVSVLTKLKKAHSGNASVSRKLVLKKLAQATYTIDRLEDASKAYEQLFELDRRDFRTALDIVKINVDLGNFGKALFWAEEAIKIAPDNGEPYGLKGLVFYRAFQDCRKDYPSPDDKVVASLAYKYFEMGERKNYVRFKRDRIYLEKNRDDLMFGIADWFLLDEEEKAKGFIEPSGDCYSWVKESIKKDPSWK
ncbi:MAG: tetratricopeptide repeat protein [Fidelibacterota bacterium]